MSKNLINFLQHPPMNPTLSQEIKNKIMNCCKVAEEELKKDTRTVFCAFDLAYMKARQMEGR